MISTLANLLQGIREAEAKKLGDIDIRHGPTIGDMYEGLTRDILDRAIPPSLDLQLVEGFVEGVNGEQSNQTDIMLVKGKGRPVPYTDSMIWDIRNVLAVIEVKKTLYGDDLADAFGKMWRIAALLKSCD